MNRDHLIKPLLIADPALSQEIRELQTTSYKVEAGIIGFEGIPQINESHASLQASAASFFGCRIDGRLAGIIALEEAAPDRWMIARLAVHPDFFRRGVGQVLAEYAISLHPEAEFRVSTGSKNSPAVQLYTRLGFKETGRKEVAPGLTITMFSRSPNVEQRA